jgi:hypothetical protein
LTNVCEFVPPSLAIPSLPTLELESTILISVKYGWSIEVKYVEQRVNVEDVDHHSTWTVGRYSQADKHNRRERTSAVETRHVLHLDGWIEGKM